LGLQPDRPNTTKGRDWILFWTAIGAITGIVVAIFTILPALGVDFREVPAILLVGIGAGTFGISVGVLLTLLIARATRFQANTKTKTRTVGVGVIGLLTGAVLLTLGVGKIGPVGEAHVAGAPGTPFATSLASPSPSASPSPPAWTSPIPGTAVGPTMPPAALGNSLDLPTALVGTWKGTAHESSPSGDFAVVLALRPGQVGSVIGQIDEPTLGNCHFILKLDKVTGQSIQATEDHDPNSSSYNCYINGVAISSAGNTRMSASLSGTSIEWKEAYGTSLSDSPTATATLTKTS
jgi:hypothetical protein